jgi:hypothetical protein
MEQNEFILRILLTDSLDFEIPDDVKEEYQISISAWDIGGQFMIDQQITFHYPQLMQMGIEELCEGDMYYGGELSIDELTKTLSEWGFVIEGSEAHAKLLNGEVIETKIKPIQDEDYEAFEKEEEFKVHESTERLIAQLEKNLQRAIAEENFEEAAEIRDEIKFLKGEK